MPLIRAVVPFIATVALIPLSAQAAYAECNSGASCTQVTAPNSGQILVTSFSDETQKRDPAHAPRRRRLAGAPVTYVLDPRLLAGPDGNPCVFIGRTEGEEGSALEVAGENRTQTLLTQFPLCGTSPKPPAKPSPSAAAALAFEQIVSLPKPSFTIPPGSSVAGMKAYMILSGPQQLDPAPINALGYPVTLHVTSTYDIDWGDDTPTRYSKGVTSQGGRGYPDGDVFHVYESKGVNTVTVTQRWTATYDIAGTGNGAIADVLSTTSSMQLPVDAYQAVVTG